MWNSAEYAARLGRLRLLRKALIQYESAFYEAFDRDFGKGKFETYTTETGYLLNAIRHTERHLRRWMRPRRVATPLVLFPGRSRIYPEPYGRVLVIGPFNYPLNLTIAPLAAALAAGNTVTLKASRQTPAVSAVIAEMLEGIFPPEVVEVVPPEVSNDELLARRFDYIFFTGSPRVGKIVMEAASRHLTPVTLELGGKSPAIVTPTASVHLACGRIAKGKFLNAGQTCVAPDYVLVHESVHDAFIAGMKQVVQDYFGDISRRPADMTLIAQQRHWERIMGLIDPAKVVVGGVGDATSRYIAPTVLDGVSWEDKVMGEEIFGPVLPVLTYSELDTEVIAKVQAGEKPLSLYLFSRDCREIRKVLREVSFGGGCVNDTVMHLGNENLPFGGVGDSGIGAYHGRFGFETFSHLKSVLHKPVRLNFDLLKPPYKDRLLRLVRRVYR